MKKFYHIDRLGSLKPGMKINPSLSIPSRFGQVYVDYFKIHGVYPSAELGKDLNAVALFAAPYYREFYLEVFRLGDPQLSELKHFSRLNSFFAFENLKDVAKFVERLKIKPGYKVFEITTEGEYVVLDMTWLDQQFGRDLKSNGYYFRHYWLGNKIEEDEYLKNHEVRGSLMEVLINSEVSIGEEVQL
ncbi:hypothetical protein RG677_002684 [Vibrio parahaemolyticus]|uniref:hypothetical protein n=2 Tax=Vibrio parahaemolyticus TaxID=670 RepID=UPI000471515F|nr:hypothetical protein [Vibrio parahaemolyticus]HDM8174553.1 hypothetical protein [Vibrio harveyi]EHK0753519.1 hypothetical protein [Vibrio parahaemolyticus]EJB8572723.1 hypothetical protein [Vibrio parahaemolyticus]ELB2951232.1 hypothetical protein [Vibrio parahaemolyticus]MCR9782799.1 hypothetical protein [Vibrio parahaemolyticus]